MSGEISAYLNIPRAPQDIAAQAMADAEAFALPAGWRAGRRMRAAFALDEQPGSMAEDALSFEPGERHDTLLVSACDVGSFLYDAPAITRQAEYMGQARYFRMEGRQGVRPIFPLPVRRIFGFKSGSDQPALTLHIPVGETGVRSDPRITRDVLYTQRLPYAEAENRVYEMSEAGFTLRGLAATARRLHAIRTGQRAKGHAGSLVNECMLAARYAAGRYMQARNIPALYHTCPLPADVAALFPAPDPAAFRNLAEPAWSNVPAPALDVNLPLCAPITSPMRSFAQFVNQCNIAAYLDRRPFPYPAERLPALAAAANRHYLLAKLVKMSYTARHNWERDTFSAHILLQQIELGNLHSPRTLTVSLFECEGQPGEVRAARAAAARCIAARPHLARSVLSLAIVRGHFRPVPAAGKGETPSLAFTDGRGNTYRHDLPLSADRLRRDIALIGSLAGLEGLEPQFGTT